MNKVVAMNWVVDTIEGGIASEKDEETELKAGCEHTARYSRKALDMQVERVVAVRCSCLR